jgi:hypothetical protein
MRGNIGCVDVRGRAEYLNSIRMVCMYNGSPTVRSDAAIRPPSRAMSTVGSLVSLGTAFGSSRLETANGYRDRYPPCSRSAEHNGASSLLVRSAHGGLASPVSAMTSRLSRCPPCHGSAKYAAVR